MWKDGKGTYYDITYTYGNKGKSSGEKEGDNATTEN